MTEAILHWEEADFHRTIQVKGAPSVFILPMAYSPASELVVEEEPFIFAQPEMGWTFRLQPRPGPYLHYYAEEPPWATQIRSAMSYMRQRMAFTNPGCQTVDDFGPPLEPPEEHYDDE